MVFVFIGSQDIEGLFQMLDYDGGGSLDTSEFCEGRGVSCEVAEVQVKVYPTEAFGRA